MIADVLRVEVRFAWWFGLYVHGVALAAALSGMTPDRQKVESTALRAMRMRVPGGRWVRMFRPP